MSEPRIKWAVGFTPLVCNVTATTSEAIRKTLAAHDELLFIAFENLISEGVHPDRMLRWSGAGTTAHGIMVDQEKACMIAAGFDGAPRRWPVDPPVLSLALTWLGAFSYLGWPRNEQGERVAPRAPLPFGLPGFMPEIGDVVSVADCDGNPVHARVVAVNDRDFSVQIDHAVSGPHGPVWSFSRGAYELASARGKL